MARWSELKGTDCARAAEDIADSLRRDQAARKSRYLRNLRLFECLEVGTADAAGYYRANLRDSEDDRLGLLRSAIQTCAAEVFAKQKPKPQFQTSGADWRTRRKAKKLDKICEGILHQRQGRWLDMWDLVFDAGIECLVQGSSAIHVFADLARKKIQHELVPVSELFVDPSEGRDPVNLFRVSPIDQDKAEALWCSEPRDKAGNERRRAAIIRAGELDDAIRSDATPRATKRIKMVTAWRLPKSKDEPGKVVVVIGGEIMAEDDWTAPVFPFVFLHWEPHRLGFWASGVIDEGARLAEDAGDLDWRLLNRARINGGRRLYVKQDSVVNREALEENEPETVVEYSGDTPPVAETLPPFTEAEFQYAKQRVQSFWDAIGVSQVSAAARREPGVESAVAMRTLNDTKAGRQLPRGKMYEKVFVDLALQHIYRLRELAAEDPDFAVSWPGKTVLKEVKWKEADPGDDSKFSVTVAPASALPNDPAGRLSMAGELYASQLIDAQTYKQLLGWPDLDQELESESAEFEYIEELIDRYLDADENEWTAGDYESPEGAIMDKQRALIRFSSAMFTAKREKAPEFNVGILRRYIGELNKQISTAATAQQSMQPAAPPPGTQAAPPAGPMPAQAQRAD